MDNINLTWYNQYSLIHNLSKYNNINEYVNKLNMKTDDKNIENKILSIEKDYYDKIKYIEELASNNNKIKILKTKNSLIILQKELEIIKILTKYTLQNKILDYYFFKLCLTLLLDFSETLRLRLNQKDIIHDNIKKKNDTPILNQIISEPINTDKTNIHKLSDVTSDKDNSYDSEFIISRCSYKFCSYQDNCSYNYNLKSKNLCYQDHYVHNMVSADLKILLKYINYKFDNSMNILHTKEILKTINTLSFVIGHMECELKTKCLYLPENQWELCHVVKNK